MRATASVALLLASSASAFNVQGFLGRNVQQRATTQAPAKWSPRTANPLKMSTAAPEAPAKGTAEKDALAEYVEKHGGNRPIRKVLIANNGMAATKSILSMRKWAYFELGDENAVQFVAMATPEDLKANAEFIKLADAYVEVPAGKNSNNYANVDIITSVAKEYNVDAVWPGWGHASENPALPTALTEMGIKFIGPTAPVMSVLGDKIAANILAQTAKVPSIPWSGSWGNDGDDGPLQANLQADGTIPKETFDKAMVHTVEEAVDAAKRIGFPVMLKASEGGGGKGIRMNANEEELRANFPQVVNEVPGSPMFMMQLCTEARHLEVQIVGDEHGNAIAINGRDCSTQRRFQKIFEEGPPTIAKPDTFLEMQRAAQRLTQQIGYIGAGTVEYLYKAETDEFFFLELNPRLQVEHPVTEGLSLVNLPATQLQVAMGIPLNRIPDIRRFYGRADAEDGDGPIDFMTEEYKDIDTHVIAARITAENPDEGFKPTSGTIERVNFQSTSNVWGYFSVGANGGIHEFADSQFGHLFAKGPNREQARKALVLALKELEVRGDIRTTVDYLVQLLETQEFKDNTIDTSWLDGIIREKSVSTELDPHVTVAAAAIYRSYAQVQAGEAGMIESLGMGQLGMGALKSLNSFPIEIAYKDVKYNFQVQRTSPDVFTFTINGGSFEAKVRESPDGSLLCEFGGMTSKIVGFEEPLGLRVIIDGTTCLLPNIFDPSELRTDVTGKVVRYLQEDGAQVEAGTPFVEVEAMKMIMPLKASESGAIKHELSAGSIISTGDLLASLTLKDPSKVKKIETFDGAFDMVKEGSSSFVADPMAAYQNVIDGYERVADIAPLENLVQGIMSGVASADEAADAVAALLQRFCAVESVFAGKVMDDVNQQLVKDKKDALAEVLAVNMAHAQFTNRQNALLFLLRQFASLSIAKFGERPMTADLTAALENLSGLEGKEYGTLKIEATSLLREASIEPFESRKASLRSTLADAEPATLSRGTTISSGVDLLTSLFTDSDTNIAKKAIETFLRRVYRAHDILKMEVTDENGVYTANFDLTLGGVAEPGPVRKGVMVVAKDEAEAVKLFPSIVEGFESTASDAQAEFASPINVIHMAWGAASMVEDDDKAIATFEDMVGAQKPKLEKMGIRAVHIIAPQPEMDPRYFSLTSCEEYKEDPLRRDMRPTFYHLLELNRLVDNYDIKRMDSVARNTQVYLGVEKGATGRGPAPQSVFLRALSHSSDLTSPSGATRVLLTALDELDRAVLDERVTATTSSRIFLNMLSEVETSPSEALETFTSLLGQLQSRYATRLLRLKVDEIEVKIRVKGSDGTLTPLRLIASSMSGKWLKPDAYLEFPDPVTGVTNQFCPLGDAETDDAKCYLTPYPTSNKLQMKRAAVRRISSTYAYDFLGLFEVSLVQRWGAYLRDESALDSIPEDIFESKEILLTDDGTVELSNDRVVGTNDIGMVAWHCFMKTPEYPEGREMVVIANDVTVQSGSFGVKEDDFFEAASLYARERGLPRIYIACNSGARIGLVETLKPMFKVSWKDEANPAQGFEYLYLTEDDYKSLPEGSVEGEMVSGPGGEKRFALSDIIGTIHGIGVENLRGSGTIAGETSRAYDETFTLSYVTGRSVGIGAYLVRLGQRTIQMQVGPMILTGYSALNKLLGRDVYTSQDQLGGPQIMFPNGVTHELVQDDQEGVNAILDWVSFVPKTAKSYPVALKSAADPIDRPVDFMPTKAPYDPRHMLAGTRAPDGTWISGFFDRNTFKEYLAGWGKSVVVGRARLGGIPMGVIAVETRLVEQRIPADPGNEASREAILPQAGQVWYPDSAFKTAQAIKDFGRGENLPLMIFANWRGFSGGTRDMAGEILKFGAMIVDALVEYQHPVFVYIPPNGELRGGAWVVIDPTINEKVMEMYADKESRGGILEPPGICEVKFRAADQKTKMHQLDPMLLALDQELEMASDADDVSELKKQISDREASLMPLYLQVAHEFADLHDRSGRMKAKGVIRDVLEWKSSRATMYWRVKRRIAEDELRNKIMEADATLDHAAATAKVEAMVGAGNYADDQKFLEYLEMEGAGLDAQVGGLKMSAIKAAVAEMFDGLDETQKQEILSGL